MRRKAPLSKDTLWVWNFKLWEEFTKAWPDKKELSRLAIDIRDGTIYVGTQETFRTLVRVALFPESQQEFFWALYQRAPDYVLAVLKHLRDAHNSASKIRRHLLSYGAPKEDCELARDIGGVSPDAVKKERQNLARLEAALNEGRQQRELERMRPPKPGDADYYMIEIVNRANREWRRRGKKPPPKNSQSTGTKRKKNSL